ncbi:MAG: DNA repair protein RecN [Proteobacteria bacterium]|nr:DNA repair protein RecN [Pseudomonadota bacterium]
MLTFLKVTGFAIIDELQVEFEDGLNIITGETGAGKSIIINALSTLINAKASSEMVRSNAGQAEVTGYFFKGDKEYLLKRIINANGRSRALLNDSPVTLSRMDELGNVLINIYGQNEFQYLLDKTSYIVMLDNILSLEDARESLAGKVKEMKGITILLETKKKEIAGRDKEIALLEFQIDEIERENLREGEEDEIKERLKVLKDAEKIRNALVSVREGMYEDDNAVYGVLKTFIMLLKPFRDIEAIEKLKARIESMSFVVEDVLLEIKGMEKMLDDDPDELQKLDDRLSRLYALKNKYGKTYEDIMMYKDAAQKRLAYLKSISDDIEELEKNNILLDAGIRQLADSLSASRRVGVPGIEKAIIDELGFLSMKGMQFKVEITDKGMIDEDGRDDVELLISTNPGEQPKPLRKIASGGELSRIMLAIKKVIGGDEERTLVFDEIDAGIGGRVADMVGKRLKDLSKKHQIICITHLPQIAVYGDHHFLVEKIQEQQATMTNIKKLSTKERIDEIARMLGGAIITEKTILRSEEMLHNAEKSRY